MASQLPPGYVPPYPDTSQGPVLLRTLWVLISISTVVLSARVYAKLWKTRRLYWDDILMVLAYLCGLAHTITATLAVSSGLGRHVLYLTAAQISNTIHMGVISLALAIASPMLGRCSFCITLLYLTGTDMRMKKWPIYVFIFLQLAVNIIFLCVFFTACGTHLSVFWDVEQHALYGKDCGNPDMQRNYGYFQGSVNTLTDAFLTTLPAILIEHTRLSLRAKLGLAFLLCLSVLAMIASIVKTYEAKALGEVTDYTYDLSPYVIWLSIELNVVIIVSSIPLLRPLFHASRPHHHRQTSNPDLSKTAPTAERWDATTASSIFTKRGSRTQHTRVDSQENILEARGAGEEQYALKMHGIHVTTEVEVSYQTNDLPFVHAALVGLVQGEIENPRLVRR